MGRSQKNRRRSFRQHLCCDFEVVAVVLHLRCIARKIKIILYVLERFPLRVLLKPHDGDGVLRRPPTESLRG